MWQARLEEYGYNCITPPPQLHWILKFILILIGGFQIMMWFGGIACFIVFGITGNTDYQTLALAIVLVLLIFLTSLFQSFQEGKSDNVMAALKQLQASAVWAIRDGEMKQVPADELVPGDIVKVNSGEKVPADVRVLSCTDLKVNNSSLTGENVDIKLQPDIKQCTLFEAKNIARSGCNFTSGNGVVGASAFQQHTRQPHPQTTANAHARPHSLPRCEAREASRDDAVRSTLYVRMQSSSSRATAHSSAKLLSPRHR